MISDQSQGEAPKHISKAKTRTNKSKSNPEVIRKRNTKKEQNKNSPSNSFKNSTGFIPPIVVTSFNDQSPNQTNENESVICISRKNSTINLHILTTNLNPTNNHSYHTTNNVNNSNNNSNNTNNNHGNFDDDSHSEHHTRHSSGPLDQNNNINHDTFIPFNNPSSNGMSHQDTFNVNHQQQYENSLNIPRLTDSPRTTNSHQEESENGPRRRLSISDATRVRAGSIRDSIMESKSVNYLGLL